jgi:hypothetical protein
MNTTFSRSLSRAGLVTAALLAGATAMASDSGPRYTYGEIGYSHVDFDNFSEDANVWGANGSFALSDQVYLTGSYSEGTIDNSPFDVNLDTAQFGAGMHFPMSPTVDLITEAAYLWEKVDVDHVGSADDDGFGLRVGVRAMVTPQFELNGGATYTDINSNDETTGYVGTVYNFTNMFSMTTGLSFNNDATAYGAGLRLYFNQR